MTAAEARYWERVHRRAATLSPDLITAVLAAFRALRDSVSEAELARLIEGGTIERIFSTALSTAVFAQAFLPVREQIRRSVTDAIHYFARDLPKGGKAPGSISFAFDQLNPRVIDAIRQLETPVISSLEDGIRETVRSVVERGLTDGKSPAAIARELRDIIGLAPNQEEAVQTFRTALAAGDRSALTRELRDKRFDKTLNKALGAEGDGLTSARIDRMTDAYRRKMLAFNAETHARTAVLDSYKLGQHLSIQDAIGKGLLPDNTVKTWVGVMDDRERDSHVAMEGETVPWDERFSNGQMLPGDDEWNCRCLARYSTPRAA